MTVSGWITFVVLGVIVAVVCGFVAWAMFMDDHPGAGVITIFLAFVIVFAMFCGMYWYYSSTASGQRAVIDERSELHGGIDRTIKIYTANGDLLAEYEGKIDIESNDGGYVKFDFDGKRYIYYNCFVETIANIS